MAAGRVGQHAHAEFADQLEEGAALAPAGRLAAERDRDDIGARPPHRFGEHGRRGIAGGSEQEPRSDLGFIE